MLNERGVDISTTIVLDCNLWISILTQENSLIRNLILTKNIQVIVTSYMVVEILRVIKRLALRFKMSRSDLETYFWDFSSYKNISLEFDAPLTEAIITEIKNRPEINIIAKLTQLEPKDIPYIVAAYQYKALLVTDDFRSLYLYKNLLKQSLNIEIITKEEFCNKFQ